MLNFPSSPTLGQVYKGPNNTSYTWDGVRWIGATPLIIPTADGNTPGLTTLKTASKFPDVSDADAVTPAYVGAALVAGQADWTQATTTHAGFIKNKPVLGTSSSKDVAATGDANATQVVLGSDTRLTQTIDKLTDAVYDATRGNMLLGLSSLTSTTNTQNTVVGNNAFNTAATGNANTLVGAAAGSALTTGASNTALGTNALRLDTTGNYNVALGVGALTANTTGSNNVAAGPDALTSNTTGGGNSAIGLQALRNNTTGNNSTAVGSSTLVANTTGVNHVAVGTNSLSSNTTGNANTGLGTNTLKAVTTGSYNTGAGLDAGNKVTTGNYNVLLGQGAGGNITTGNSNIAIGANSANTLTTGTNVIVIGDNAVPSSATVSNEMTLGGTGINNTRLRGALSVGNATPNPGALGNVLTSNGPLVEPSWTPFNMVNNLQPEAGIGNENVVPMSSAYPNTIGIDSSMAVSWIDAGGQKTTFFCAMSPYGTLRLARNRYLNNTPVTDDSNPKVAGEDVIDIINGSRTSMCVRTATNKILVLDPKSNADTLAWVLKADVTTINGTKPLGNTSSIRASSFQYVPETGKIIRVVLMSDMKIYTQLIDPTTVTVVSTALSLDLSAVMDYTGGEAPTVGLTMNGGYVRGGLGFAYSAAKKELVFKINCEHDKTLFADSSYRWTAYAVMLNVPDTVFSGNDVTLITSKIPTYTWYSNVNNGTNGVILAPITTGAGQNGYRYSVAWDPFSSTYIENRINWWPTDNGTVNWGFPAYSATLNFAGTYSTLGIPDGTYVGKSMASLFTVVGASNIATIGSSYRYGGSKYVTIPFNGTTTLEGHTIYKTLVSSITPVVTLPGNTSTNFYGVAYDGSSNTWWQTRGAGNAVAQWSESTGGWSQTLTTTTEPTFPSAYTRAGNRPSLYVSSVNKFFCLAYKNSDIKKYVYLIRYDASSVTEVTAPLMQSTVDAYFTSYGTTVGVYSDYVNYGLVDGHFFVGLCYPTVPGNNNITNRNLYTFAKDDILTGTVPATHVRLQNVNTWNGGPTVGQTPDGKLYIANSPGIVGTGNFASKQGTVIRIEKWNSSADYVASAAPAETIDLTTATVAGLGLFVSSYPIYLGGSMRTIPQGTFTLNPNKLTYVLAIADPTDNTKASISLIDYLPAGSADSLNSLNQVCLAEITTDSEKFVSKLDYTVRRDTQSLSYANGTLSLSRGNSVVINPASVTAAGLVDLTAGQVLGAGSKVVDALIERHIVLTGTAIDVQTSGSFSKTISAATTFTFTNAPAAGLKASFILELTNGGSQTITWPTSVKWTGKAAPVLTASGVDILKFYSYDAGVTWRGFVLSKDNG